MTTTATDHVARISAALQQYRSDMLHPPAPDSRERRVAMIDQALVSVGLISAAQVDPDETANAMAGALRVLRAAERNARSNAFRTHKGSEVWHLHTREADEFKDAADRIDAARVALALSPLGGPDAEDWLADVLSDSMDMDWTTRVGARAIMAALRPVE